MGKRKQDATMPRRAYSYLRISSWLQRLGRGLRRQANFAKEICDEQGWILDDTLTYVDQGRSGFHKHNLSPTAALTRFLRDVEASPRRILPGSVLVIESLDRLSRADIDEGYDLFRRILNAGIWIATYEPRRIYRKEDAGNMLAILEPLFILSRGNEESRMKKVRATDAWEDFRATAEAGKPHRCTPPFWIKRDGDSYVLIPERAAVVRRIFHMAAAGMGSWRIARQLEDEGVEFPGPKGSWWQALVARMLRSRTPVGEYQPQKREGKLRISIGAPIKDFYPAVVSDDEWQSAQRAIDSRRTTRGRPTKYQVNLFTGMVFEGDTGERYMLKTAYVKGQTIVYMIVRKRRGHRLRYDLFERAVMGTLAQLKPSDVLSSGEQIGEAQQRLVEARMKHTALCQRRKQIQTMLADPRFSADDLAPALAENSELLKAAESELQRAQWEVDSGRADALASVQSLHDELLSATGEAAEELRVKIKEALPSVLERIDVRPIGEVRRGCRHLVTLRLRGGAERPVVVESSVRYATKQS